MLPYYKVKRIFAFAVFFGYGIFGGTAFFLFVFRLLSELELAIICSPYAVIAGASVFLFKDVVVDNRESSIYHFNEDDLKAFFKTLETELVYALSPHRALEYYYILCSRYNTIVETFRATAIDKIRNASSKNEICLTELDIEELLRKEVFHSFLLHKGAILSEPELRHYLKKIIHWLKGKRTYVSSTVLPPWRYIPILVSGFLYPFSGTFLLFMTSKDFLGVTPTELASAAGLISALFASYWNSIVSEFLGIE